MYISILLILVLFIVAADYIITKTKFKYFLTDEDYNKPQSFHSISIPRSGGVLIFFAFVIYFCIFFNGTYLNIFLSLLGFFLVGLIDDLKIINNPIVRLILLFLVTLFAIHISELLINRVNLPTLDYVLKIEIISYFFTLIAIIFIVNGANFIDGFNGLLGIQSLTIFLILFLINFLNGNEALALIILYFSCCTLIFLYFNFPYAKIFMGDSGSFLTGSAIAIFVIKSYQLNDNLSSTFFACILFYLFYETFFSFFRKLIVFKKSPLRPDSFHLHMLTYKLLLKSNLNQKLSNYLTSILCNLCYITLLIPLLFIANNTIFCLVYFIILLFFYTSVYLLLFKFSYDYKK